MSAELQWLILLSTWLIWWILWFRDSDKIEDDIYYQGKERTKNKIPSPFWGFVILFFILPLAFHPLIFPFIVILGFLKYKEIKY